MGAALVGAVVGAVVAGGVLGFALLRDDSDAPVAATASTRPTTADALDIRALLEMAEPSVVSIRTATGGGSGFVISEDGLVVTNDHVISGASDLQVVFLDGEAVDAELVGSFPDEDIALVKASGVSDLVPATLGSSADLQVGDPVVAIGNALGLGVQPSVTSGIVSAKNRALETDTGLIENLIQTDAAINPGNSGGPLLDANGEIVGVNTLVARDAQNIGFAIEIDAVKPLIDELRAGGGEVTGDTGYLGVTTIDVGDPGVSDAQREEWGVARDTGALVLEVVPGSAADGAGLRPGDVVFAIDGEPVASTAELGQRVRQHEAGDTVAVQFDRSGTEQTVSATLGRR